MKAKVFSIIVFIASTCLALLGGEFIIRTWFPAHAQIIMLHETEGEERSVFTRYDKVLGWDGRESVDDDFEWADCRHHVHQNRFGYRGPEYDKQGKRGRRVVVLGDSFVWGFGVEDRELFTNRIEREAQGRIEMINMGVSGFGTDQEYLLWTLKGREWAPDDVLLMVFLPTDFWDNIEAERYGYPKPLFRFDASGRLVLTNVPVPPPASWSKKPQASGEKVTGPVHWLLDHSALARLLLNAASRHDRLREQIEARRIIPARKAGKPGKHEYSIYYLDPDSQSIYAWDILFALIDKLNADVRKSNGILTVVVIPSIVQVYPDLWSKFMNYSGPLQVSKVHPDAPNLQITRWCKAKGIRVIDLLPGMRDAGKSNPYLYFPINLHWTADGHRIAAEILTKELSFGISNR